MANGNARFIGTRAEGAGAVSGRTTAPAGGQQGSGQGRGPAGGQDSETLRKLREKVREINALSASHRKGKGGKTRARGGAR